MPQFEASLTDDHNVFIKQASGDVRLVWGVNLMRGKLSATFNQ
jgi:hypothetical protein